MTTPSLHVITGETKGSYDALVVGVRGTEKGLSVVVDPGAESLLDTQVLAGALAAVGASSGKDSVVTLPSTVDGISAIVAVGLGAAVGPTELRYAAGVAARALASKNSVLYVLPLTSDEEAIAILEGAALGSYRFTTYKSTKPTVSTTQITVLTATPVSDDVTVRATVTADAVARVKDLVATPALDLYPANLADLMVETTAGLPIDAKVWNEAALNAEGFGGIGGVGQGSSRPPRLVRLDYSPQGASKHISLVGKGITFDTGGLSLKPPASMIGMKYDMTGAATMFAVIVAAAQLELPVRITAWLALAENMPSSTSIRPGDVLTIKGGTTVEVLNTDAEGRLVMADALVVASEEHPDVIIDAATLTGAATVALGKRYVGALGDADAVLDVVAAATAAGESFWHMPIPEELRPLLDSDIADIANVKPGNAAAGMSVAAAFLKDFVGLAADGETTIPWVHLDIAGPANNDGAPYGFTGKGSSGVAVRALLRYLGDQA